MRRRDFLRVSALAGGGLLMSIDLRDARGAGVFEPSAWLRVHADDSVKVMVAEAEIGQGVTTSVPQLVADALDADWKQVSYELASSDEKFGRQSTGGSTSIRRNAVKLRQAGAVARELLVRAAAEQWKVEAASCTTSSGEVIHPDGSKRLSYGALVDAASILPVPESPPAKIPVSRGIAGKPLARFDIPSKTDGTAQFGLDVRVPGALIARVVRPPIFGSKIDRVDDRAAKAVPGVEHVVRISSGVAVVARDYWSASRGVRKLKVTYQPSQAAQLSTAGIRAALDKKLEGPGAEASSHGDVEAALRSAAKMVEATYEVPFLAHAPMEPLNFTAHVTPGKAELWGPTQVLTSAKKAVMRITGLTETDVTLHATLIGGGFGRRLEVDYVEDATEISKKLGVPVQVVWSRPDMMRHGAYRPAALSRFRAGLDASGRVVAWHNRIASPSILAGRGFSGRVDATSVEGASELPYSIDHFRCEVHRHDTAVPVGFWRSVGASQNAFFTETFFDEVARAAGQDPLTYRLKMLGTDKRYRAVLELAAKEAGWGTAPPAGRHRGIAVAKSFQSYVAHVAEVSVQQGNVRVHRLVCAVDCGRVVNPDTVRAQMEGGANFGLAAALRSRISVKDGRVRESNFHDYQVLRMNEAPEIDVHIVDSNAPWGGVGEPGVPPAAPAVANAVLAATGKPVRSLPIEVTA